LFLGHLGRDGRMYLLDFARVFPPESPPLVDPPKGDKLFCFCILKHYYFFFFPKDVICIVFCVVSLCDQTFNLFLPTHFLALAKTTLALTKQFDRQQFFFSKM
jgi:hypothetical protein